MWPVCVGVVVYGVCAVSLCGAVVAVWGAAPTDAPAPSQAMTAGYDAFRRGDMAAAAHHWQAAARDYEATKQPQAHSVALTYLAQAYAALGHYDRAASSLDTALLLAEQVGDRIQVARVWAALGDLAVTTGDLAAADQRLNEALTRARMLGDDGLVATILHTRGNLLMSQRKAHEALGVYRDSAVSAQQAGQFGTAARALAHAALAAEQEKQYQTAKALLDEAMAHLRQLEASHDKAYDLVLIGRGYHRLADTSPVLVLRAAEVFSEAAGLAQSLEDPRALSYAWGYLGRLYEEERRHEEALQLTRRATLAAQQVYIPESLYLWQWQTGRLLRALGDIPAASAAYERATETVQSMRPELLRGYAGTYAPFRASLGPLYFELTDLLLRQAAALEAQGQDALPPQYEHYLQRARATVEQFKTAELRDYSGMSV